LPPPPPDSVYAFWIVAFMSPAIKCGLLGVQRLHMCTHWPCTFVYCPDSQRRGLCPVSK